MMSVKRLSIRSRAGTEPVPTVSAAKLRKVWETAKKVTEKFEENGKKNLYEWEGKPFRMNRRVAHTGRKQQGGCEILERICERKPFFI